MQRSGIRDALVLGVLLVVLASAVALRASLTQPPSQPSTYDSGPNGYAALYALLAREGRQPQRFEQPLNRLASVRGTLIVGGNNALELAGAPRGGAAFIDSWIRRGGTLAIFGQMSPSVARDFGAPAAVRYVSAAALTRCGIFPRRAMVTGAFTLGMPVRCTRSQKALLVSGVRSVGIAYRRGAGTVVYVPTTTPLDNLHLAQRDNARFAYALFGAAPAWFDERIYGHASDKGFWDVVPLPMRVAAALACALVLFAVIGANLPFAPPLQSMENSERDTGEYLTSLARMLERAGARKEPIDRFFTLAHNALRVRTQGDLQARALEERMQALRALPHPTQRDLIAAAQLSARVRKDYSL